MDVVNGVTHKYTITSRIISLTEQIDNVIQSDNRRLLEPHLQQMKTLTLDISNRSRYAQGEPSETLNKCLEKLEDKVKCARLLIHRPQRPQQCFDCLLSKPKPSGGIYEWETNVNKLLNELQIYQRFLLSPELQIEDTEIEDDDVIKHTGFKYGEVVVERWLREDPGVPIIGVCGGAGVGKTKLLQNVYNTYKVSDIFDVVIWVTVGQSGIPELQDCIARTLNLDLGVHHSNSQMGKHERKIKLSGYLSTKKFLKTEKHVKLSEYLKTKKFLLIFDNMWNPLDLKKLGMEFGDDKGSKFICSSRMSHVIRQMRAKNVIFIQPLTRREAWELFRNVAFKDSHLPHDLEHTARQVVDRCKGSPLAVNLTAATMRGNTSQIAWNLALSQIQTPIYHTFPDSSLYADLYQILKWDSSLDADLYQILKWNYGRLHANLKNCFLCCAMFPREEEIEVDKLVGMWIAEGFVWSEDPNNLIDIAHGYIKILVDRCFFQVTHIPHGALLLKISNTLYDVAMRIGITEDCMSAAGQQLQIVPMAVQGEGWKNWKRVSLYGNDIKLLPESGLKLRDLVSLVLGANKELEEVPDSFLVDLPCLRVLDLSRTKIKRLPMTLWQLTQLKYLDVSYTQIEYLSAQIGRLFRLQFLNLAGCSNLKSLPKSIGNLTSLQSLSALGCSKLTSIPSEIYEIKSLKCVRISPYNVL